MELDRKPYIELDWKTNMEKGTVETTWAGIRQIFLPISELCNFAFQFPYRDKKMYFKELLIIIRELIELFL